MTSYESTIVQKNALSIIALVRLHAYPFPILHVCLTVKVFASDSWVGNYGTSYSAAQMGRSHLFLNDPQRSNRKPNKEYRNFFFYVITVYVVHNGTDRNCRKLWDVMLVISRLSEHIVMRSYQFYQLFKSDRTCKSINLNVADFFEIVQMSA